MKPQLILVLCIIAIHSVHGQTQDAYPKKIKVLSWNIFMLPGVAKAKGRSARAAAIGEILSKSDYDIIVFQEAFQQRARRKVRKYLAKVYPYQAGPANRKFLSLKTNSGLWIFSKYPITDSHAIVFKNRSGIDAFSRKGALLAEINVGHQLIQVVGTHLQSSGGDWIRHSQCVEFYHKLLKEHHKPYVPQIICGDFNINKSNEEVYRQMLQILGAKDGDLTGDFHYSYDRVKNDLKQDEGKDQHLIDYILLRNADNDKLTCVNRQIRAFRKSWCPKHADLSDHFAVEAEIQLGDENIARNH
jgi:sphingomyelin phosphodiesterase